MKPTTKFAALAAAVALSATAAGCDQWAARTGFGKLTQAMPCGQKLENVTWKGPEGTPELWTLSRPMRPGESPETHSFKAHTLFGVLEGEVILTESVCVSIEEKTR